jgi:alanyl-tRNA synthetase
VPGPAASEQFDVVVGDLGREVAVGHQVVIEADLDGDKVQIAAGVTADSVGKLKAGELVNFVAQQVGGKGGGKPDMAMAGGTDASKLPAALASVTGWVTQQLG